GIRDFQLTGVQTCALPICPGDLGVAGAGLGRQVLHRVGGRLLLHRDHGHGVRDDVVEFAGDAGALAHHRLLPLDGGEPGEGLVGAFGGLGLGASGRLHDAARVPEADRGQDGDEGGRPRDLVEAARREVDDGERGDAADREDAGGLAVQLTSQRVQGVEGREAGGDEQGLAGEQVRRDGAEHHGRDGAQVLAAPDERERRGDREPAREADGRLGAGRQFGEGGDGEGEPGQRGEVPGGGELPPRADPAGQAETAPYTMENLSPEARAGYAEIARTARDALVEMRRLLSVLRADAAPDEDGGNSPQPRLDWLPDLIEQHRGAGGRVDLAVQGEPRALSTTVELSAYRIVQEALTNARRHAPGAEVRVELTFLPDRLAVRVRDDGSPASPASPGHDPSAPTRVLNRDD